MTNEHGTYKTKLHFRFEGDRERGIESIDVAVPRLVLEAFPDTVLATLAQDAWNNSADGELAGELPDQPLITKPLDGPCRDHWSPNLVTMIKEAYLWKYYEKNEDKIRMGVIPNLPPKVCQHLGAPLPSLPPNAKIQDALTVLDYYGLAIDPNVIDLDQLSDAEQIKTAVFLRDLSLMEQAISFVVDTLKQKPQHETLFLFAKESADMTYINRKNCFSQRPISPHNFVRMGDEGSDCQGHFEWSRRQHQRRIFMEQLQEKLPTFPVQYLQVNFSQHDHVVVEHDNTNLLLSSGSAASSSATTTAASSSSSNNNKNKSSSSSSFKEENEFSYIETRDLQDGSITVRPMVVLSVTVPGLM